jgi:hypothetical protein
VRAAHSIAKSAFAAPYFDLKPVFVGDDAALDVNDPAEAIAQLKEIGRQRWPSATEAQQFEKAFTDPANAEIAAKAYRRPGPTRLSPSRNENPAMTENLRDIAKRVATDGDARGHDEHSFVELITAQAKREHPELSAAQAFAKAFTAAMPVGVLLRQAHAVVKSAMLAQPEPRRLGCGDCRATESASSAGRA